MRKLQTSSVRGRPDSSADRASISEAATLVPGKWGRDTGAWTTRNSSKGALVSEAHAIFRALGSGAALGEVRGACLSGRLLRQKARETRHRIWDALHWRFFAWAPPQWVLEDLVAASANDVTSPRFVGLVFIHHIRRDRLTFDFVTEKLCLLWKDGVRDVRRNDVMDFLASTEGERARWRESTRIKLAGNVLSALRDFGLLVGVQRKTLQRPIVPPEVVLHLCRLLDGEGLRGRTLLEARDWRLFFWDLQDISQALGQLAQRGEIRFERSGRTVILEVPSHPHREGQ